MLHAEEEASGEDDGGRMKAAKISSVQPVARTLKAQDSVPSSIFIAPATVGP